MSDLRAMPGVVVTESESRDGLRHIYGLRDPYAPQPAEMLEPAGIRPESVVFHWEAFQSSHPEYARRRIEAIFSPPATVRLTFADGVLKAEGAARGPWISDARRLAKAVPWIDAYDEAGLVDIDQRLEPPATVRLTLTGQTLEASGTAPEPWIAKTRAAAAAIPGITEYRDDGLIATGRQDLERLKRKIEAAVFHFAVGRPEPAPGQEAGLQDLERAALQLAATAKETGQPFRIEVVGHSDSSGPADLNLKICRDRAQTLRDRLVSAGMPEGYLTVRAAGSNQPLDQGADDRRRALDRRVTFEVTLLDP